MEERAQFIYSRGLERFAGAPLGVLKQYFLVTKPASVSLLVFTGTVGFAAASRGVFPPTRFTLLLLALTLGCAGANTLTCYLDRDIDAIMERTRGRPIPTSRISPGKALIFGATLAALGLAISLWINSLTFALALLGMVNNVLMYSAWAKRRTPANIFIGGLAGALPAMGGYAAYANGIDVRSLFLGAIVMVWIPLHVWSIALRYKKDYTNAGVPMLPAVVTPKRAVQFIALLSGLLVVLSLMPAVLHLFGPVYLYSAASLGAIVLLLSVWLMVSPSENRAWIVFKASSPYLGLLFLSVLLDAVLGV